ncbi:hypothetical protein [Kutzneria kofuensis]|jgi:hypothetical protein|uniref:N-acetyltransferase domain-containing protein n=1 Tax=Kutzneria kofuensis TaxID=103725 RepID=A0A7W9KNN2_9PSEU|nr:hypothetical protein [Kutzneria kofuensis]MBB5895797.1 hypothetical protein [Kutzneria kofuensis]
MTEIQRLDPDAAVAELRASADSARGFLGLDPVTQNDALLTAELEALEAQLFSAGETLVGFAPNADQPRQAYVASTSADPEPLRALLEFLTTYQRCTTFVAMVPDGAVAAAGFTACGFEQVGVLPRHRWQNYDWQDVLVYVGRADSCRS